MTRQPTDSAATSKIDEMRQVLRQEREERAAACWAEIQEVLKKHRCTLDAIPQFSGNAGVFSVIVIQRVTAQD